jgi:predicted Zn-dependent peptidase
MSRRPKFKKTVFKNGLTLLTERHSQFQSLSVGVWVQVGTRHEQPREAGVSHFLEHMLFKGTENRSALEIARSVDQVGGDFNAFTTREYTCFHMLTLSRDVKLVFDILGDVILNSDFDSEELERERKVILQEISMVEEAPEELVQDLFFEVIYGKHGLGRPILGTETSIRRMRRRDVLKFFRKNYRPESTIISVAGNVSHETVRRHIKSLAKTRWPGRVPGKLTKKETGFERAPKLKEGIWWIKRNTEQVHLVWGVEGMTYAHKDRFVTYLLNAYLGEGMSSQLFQEIREKNGLAYTVYSSLSAFVDAGLFSIYAATGMNQVPLCLRLIEECVEKVKRDLLTVEELQEIKDSLNGTILLNSDSVESRMSSIAKNQIFLGKILDVKAICELIDVVTPEDIRRVARKIFRHGRRSILLMGPRPSKQVRAKLKPKLLPQFSR